MRRQNLATASLVVFVETNSFRPQDAQYHASKLVHLPVGTADSGKLIAAAKRALDALWKDGYRYKKAGVMLLDLVPARDVHAGLFDRLDDNRSQARMKAIDTLNGRYGRDTISYAATGRKRAWKLRRDLLSKRYTTDWDELLSAGEITRQAAQSASHRHRFPAC
jgi:DNA polymerase V